MMLPAHYYVLEKTQLREVSSSTQGKQWKGETFGLLLFQESNSFKKLKDQNAIEILMIPGKNNLRKNVIVEAAG